MSAVAALVDKLVASGMAAGEAAEMVIAALNEKRRSSGAARTAKWRENKRHRDAVTSQASHVTADPAPSKVPPITPLNTPQGSEPNGSAADAAPPSEVEIIDEDPKARLFRLGKTALVSFGIAEKRTGALIGQWLKAKNDPSGLLAAIQFARDQNVAEPVAYVSALVSGKGKQNAGFGALASAADDLIARAEKRAVEDAAFTIDVTPGRC